MGSCEVRAVVLDIPLLMECGRLDLCDKLVFVACSEEIRADRVSKKGPGHEDRLKKREKFQISLDRKAEIAHYTINNNSDLSALSGQVAGVFSALMQ
jgi:dephospho-CoA kinase